MFRCNLSWRWIRLMSWTTVLCPPTLNFVYSPQSIMLMDVGDLLLV